MEWRILFYLFINYLSNTSLLSLNVWLFLTALVETLVSYLLLTYSVMVNLFIYLIGAVRTYTTVASIMARGNRA